MNKPLAALGVLTAFGAGGTWWYLRCRPPEEIRRYTVIRGDTLSKIARREGVTVAQLKAWNHLRSDRIDVGQVLVVGRGGSSAPPPRAHHRHRHRGPSTHRVGGPPPEDAPTEAPLSMPAPKACRSGPSMVDAAGEEPTFVGSKGLDHQQVEAAMNAFLPKLQRCFRSGEAVSGTLDLSITVGCDGRVSNVTVEDDGGLPDDLISCVQKTLSYAPFPAHDQPDGFTFQYPMHFDFGG